MFRKILIANRGEICCRVAVTAARLGIRTVAVYSEVDSNAKHVSVCDEALSIGGTTAGYLSISSILSAAKESRAEAIHPGYGFLAENAEFAEACAAAGLVFIGPSPAAIRTMGDKSAAKAVMAKARVIGEPARTAARAVNYTGAGTIEFLVDRDANFHFLEMNTRLQVEHPVTELITGQDLVEWQLLVAAGSPLPLSQDQLSFRGHAIETRIYAEKPSSGFLPATGTLQVFRPPQAIEFTVPASLELSPVRLDAGVRSGDTVTPYYDPLLAKLIVWGKDRPEAVTRLRAALDEFVALGVETNLPFLRRLIASSDFLDANLDTGLIARNESFLLTSEHVIRFPFIVLATAALLKIEEESRRIHDHDPYSPWSVTSGWRLNSNSTRSLSWSSGNQTVDVLLTYPATTAKPSRYRLEV